MDAPPDERLIRSALEGDDEAFAELVRRHKRTVLRIAARFARNAADLEDLGQETFLRAYRDLAGYRRDAPFGHWVSRITVRTCYDALRKRRREEKEIALDGLALPPPDPASEGEMSVRDARLILDRAMAKLKPGERMVITLLELEERTIREVAEMTGWSPAVVKVRAFRARQALKRIMGGNDA